MLLHHIIIESQNKNMSPAINIQYAFENFSAEILNNLNFMKSMLTGCLTQNFISTKFKKLTAEKHREGLSYIKNFNYLYVLIFNLLFHCYGQYMVKVLLFSDGYMVTLPEVDCVWNVMAHAQKPDFVFWQNGRVHLNQQGRQFSRLLAAELCAPAVVMLDTPCSEVVWRALPTHSIRQFPFTSPPVRHRVPSRFNWTLHLNMSK
jgi:hypothetical protein